MHHSEAMPRDRAQSSLPSQEVLLAALKAARVTRRTAQAKKDDTGQVPRSTIYLIRSVDGRPSESKISARTTLSP